MLQQEICPDCGELIPAERMDEEMSICECGFVKSSSQSELDKHRNKKSSYVIICLSLFLMSSFIHTAKWGKESVTVTPLEVSRVFGTISPNQALELGDMSAEKNFLSQAEEMYKIYLQKNPDDLEVNKKMGMLMFRQEKYADSAQYLEKYFLNGGEDQITLFSYGKALTETQDLGEAEEVFLRLIKAKPETYQLTVVQALIDLYIAQGKLSEAKEFIGKLIKPGYEIPDHLMEQKAFIRELMKKS